MHTENFKFSITKNYNNKLLSMGYVSLIVAVFPYFYKKKGNLFSMYCSIYDYHKIIPEIFSNYLDKLELHYKIFTDISPFNEKVLAQSLGLGEIGKNNLLLTKEYSSFVFIAEAAVKEELNETVHDQTKICTGCLSCVRACPTKALTNGFQKEKCLSYINQKRNLTQEEKQLLKGTASIYGCDICQLVCPVTKNAGITNIQEFKHPVLDLTKDKILNMTDTEFDNNYHNFAFHYKGLDILKRNIHLL